MSVVDSPFRSSSIRGGDNPFTRSSAGVQIVSVYTERLKNQVFGENIDQNSISSAYA